MKKIVWGVLLIAVAVLVILNAAGVELGVIGGIAFNRLLLSAVLLAVAICLAIDSTFWLIPFPLAAIFCVLEKDIARWIGSESTNIISNWLVFGCAALMAFGISLITSPIKRMRRKAKQKIVSGLGAVCYDNHNGGNSSSNSCFSSETKFIDCKSFKNYYYYIKMGNGTVFFENADAYTGGGTLTLECSMGNIDVTVPSDWRIEADIKTSMGSTTLPAETDKTGPVLYINGTNKMGSINIKYD